MSRVVTILVTFILCCHVAHASTELISTGAVWRYLDDGSDQGSLWRTNGFDDSSWSNGPARLGYGDSEVVTELSFGPDSDNKFATYYFRHSFVLTNASMFVALDMKLLRDDGAVVYVNDTEMWRDEMPTGVITYTTFASSTASGAEEDTFYERSIEGTTHLVTGTNVVAVEVHQRSGTSSDIGFDFAFVALTSLPPATITRAPYLQMGTPTSIVVRWRTDKGTDSLVRYGDAHTNLTMTYSNASVTTEHEVALSGLSATTRYYYGVGHSASNLAGADTNHYFTTSPPHGERNAFRIWVLGDSGTADGSARSVRDAFHAWSGTNQPDLILMLGDNAYNDGTDEEYQDAVFEMYTNVLPRTVLWATLGNHDGHTASSPSQTGPYYDIFTFSTNGMAGGMASGTEAYYSFDYANAHFVCLDSYDTSRETNDAMLLWLGSDLAATTQEWIIAFWHHPPYTKGSHNSDSESRLVDMRENALPILEAGGIDLVLCGHSHSYERSYLLQGHHGHSTTLTSSMLINNGSGRTNETGAYNTSRTNGAVYAVAGSSGKISGGSLNHPAMFISLNELGSMILDVEGDRMNASFVNSSTTLRDYFTLSKGTAFRLSLHRSGAGSLQPTGGDVDANATIELTATPSNFYSFGSWTGDLSSTSNPIDLVMDTDKVVEVVFEPILVTNGVPQWWLDAKGLSTDDEAATNDQDMDGTFTWEEFFADTDPTNRESSLTFMSLTPTGLSWKGGIMATQYVEQASDLDGPWSPILTNLPPTAITNLTGAMEGVATSLYFRIRVPSGE